MQNLLTQILLTKVKDPTTAGTSDIDTDIVDAANWENIVFFTSFGTAAANNNIKVQQDSDPTGATMADLENTKTGNGASDEDVGVEIVRPRASIGRYLRARVLRGTSTTCGDIWCLRYNGREIPDNIISGTIYTEIHASPALGTA